MKVEKGQVYVPKGNGGHAIMIESVSKDGAFFFRDTRSRNTKGSFALLQSIPGVDLLGDYELATPESLKHVVGRLEEEVEVAGVKAAMLREYCARVPNTEGIKSITCIEGGCSFDYPAINDYTNYRFLSCPHAVLMFRQPFTLQCVTSGKKCTHT